MSICWLGLTIQTYPRSIILQIQDRNRNSYYCRVALMGNLYTWHYWTRPIRVVRLDLWPQSFYIYRQQHRWTRWFRWRLPRRTTPLSPPQRSSPQSYCNRQKHNHVLWTIVEYNSIYISQISVHILIQQKQTKPAPRVRLQTKAPLYGLSNRRKRHHLFFILGIDIFGVGVNSAWQDILKTTIYMN